MQNLKLLAARKRLGLTIKEVARRAGIDRTHYAKIERGERTPSLAVAGRVASVLQETPQALFFDQRGDKVYLPRAAGD